MQCHWHDLPLVPAGLVVWWLQGCDMALLVCLFLSCHQRSLSPFPLPGNSCSPALHVCEYSAPTHQRSITLSDTPVYRLFHFFTCFEFASYRFPWMICCYQIFFIVPLMNPSFQIVSFDLISFIALHRFDAVHDGTSPFFLFKIKNSIWVWTEMSSLFSCTQFSSWTHLLVERNLLSGPAEAISMTSIRLSEVQRPSMRTMKGLSSWYMISASLIISSFTIFSLSFFSTLTATSIWPLKHTNLYELTN